MWGQLWNKIVPRATVVLPSCSRIVKPGISIGIFTIVPNICMYVYIYVKITAPHWRFFWHSLSPWFWRRAPLLCTRIGPGKRHYVKDALVKILIKLKIMKWGNGEFKSFLYREIKRFTQIWPTLKSLQLSQIGLIKSNQVFKKPIWVSTFN